MEERRIFWTSMFIALGVVAGLSSWTWVKTIKFFIISFAVQKALLEM